MNIFRRCKKCKKEITIRVFGTRGDICEFCFSLIKKEKAETKVVTETVIPVRRVQLFNFSW
jgi:hypothetical protein